MRRPSMQGDGGQLEVPEWLELANGCLCCSMKVTGRCCLSALAYFPALIEVADGRARANSHGRLLTWQQ